MIGHECPHEQEILDAAAGGLLSASQREHIAGCDVCREALAVDTALRELAATAIAEAPQHDYRVAWLAAGFAARQQRLARLDFLSAACLGAVAAFGAVGLAILLSPGFLNAIRTRIPAGLGDAGIYLTLAMLVAGCLGIWALWDRKLGARR